MVLKFKIICTYTDDPFSASYFKCKQFKVKNCAGHKEYVDFICESGKLVISAVLVAYEKANDFCASAPLNANAVSYGEFLKETDKICARLGWPSAVMGVGA